MSRPAISVVMPVYNRESWVVNAAESILSQTFADFEFIIVDDASTDGTPALLAELARRDSRVQVLTLPVNSGQSLARAVGHTAAGGDYIAVMDSDDRAHPDRLQRQYAFMEAHPEITLCGSRAVRVTGRQRAPMPMRLEDAELKARLLYVDRTFVHPTVIMRRDFLQRHYLNYGAERRGDEDYEFYNRLVACGGRLANMPDVLLDYHRHPGGISRNTPDMELRKLPLREFLLGLYYPDLSRREVVALARIVVPVGRLDLKLGYAGLLAGEKAMGMLQSRYGEDHGALNAILAGSLTKLEQELARHSRRS